MDLYAFYVIKECFFKDVDEPCLKYNKDSRPHYYCFLDESTKLYWMIPTSTKIEKYKKEIQKRVDKGRPCDVLHIERLDNGQESAFLIQDMFPVTLDYIERIYTLGGNHFKVTSQSLIDIINKKASNILGLIRKGVKLNPTQPNVLKIEKFLLDKDK